MNAAMLLALLEVAKFGVDTAHDLQSGAITPTDAAARWQMLRDRIDGANALWDAATGPKP